MNGSNGNTSGANEVVLEATPKSGEDCISNAHLEEIARRLKGRVENQNNEVFWTEQTPPDDKTKIWWPVDPQTGTPIGQPKIWDEATETWIALGTVTLPAFPRRARRNGILTVAAGSAAATFTFESIGTKDYMIYLTPTRKIGANFIAASANMTGFGMQVIAQELTSFTVHIFAAPTDGLGIMWEIQDNTER